MSILSKNIRKIRKELSCTQSMMAEILEIGLRTYVRYESGERDAPVSVLVKLAYFGNISLEQFLTRAVNVRDISPAQEILQLKKISETKLVDFEKGEIVFKKPVRHELITIDSSEKKLLAIFRKMDVGLQKVCVNNIQNSVNSDGLMTPLRPLTVRKTDRSKRGSILKNSKVNTLAKKKNCSDSKKESKKLLKEKIDRLKTITKSISGITVK